MKKKKPRVYCFVPGCTNKPVTNRHEGYGRCPKHRYVSQQGVQNRHSPAPIANRAAT